MHSKKINNSKKGVPSKNVFYISVGSNIEREKNIAACAKQLKKKFRKMIFSPVFETAPAGYQLQENFFNAVCRAESAKTIEEVREILCAIEAKLKRKRTRIKSGPRTIDLDLMIWNTKTVHEGAAESYNLPGLKAVLRSGEAQKGLEEIVLRHKGQKAAGIDLNASFDT